MIPFSRFLSAISYVAGGAKTLDTKAKAMPFVQPRVLNWRKSSFCQQGECAELAREGDEILLRSTRAPGQVVRLTTAEWQALVRGIRAHEFELT
jgi:hypothetical protein